MSQMAEVLRLDPHLPDDGVSSMRPYYAPGTVPGLLSWSFLSRGQQDPDPAMARAVLWGAGGTVTVPCPET